MTRRMTQMFAMALMCALVTATLGAAQSVAGNWTMKVEGGPHGPAEMGLTLAQDGDVVSAQFDPGHDTPIAMTGKVVKGELTLASEIGDNGGQITIKATLKPDGALAGYMSSLMGDMTFAATKVK